MPCKPIKDLHQVFALKIGYSLVWHHPGERKTSAQSPELLVRDFTGKFWGRGSPERVGAVDWRLVKSCSQMLLCYFKWLHLVHGRVL